MTLLVILILLFIVFGGGGFFYNRGGYGSGRPAWGGNLLYTLAVIVLAVFLFQMVVGSSWNYGRTIP